MASCADFCHCGMLADTVARWGDGTHTHICYACMLFLLDVVDDLACLAAIGVEMVEDDGHGA